MAKGQEIMRAGDHFAAFAGGRYLSLETCRRDGTAVRTPVWFAAGDGVLYLYSVLDSGKVKRVRRDGRSRIAPCDMRGAIRGPWMETQASLVEGAEFTRAMRLLDRKYFPWKQLLGLARLFNPKPRAVIRLDARSAVGAAPG